MYLLNEFNIIYDIKEWSILTGNHDIIAIIRLDIIDIFQIYCISLTDHKVILNYSKLCKL